MSNHRQVPLGDPYLICPMHKQPMSKVCHKCPLWVRVQGKNPQSEEFFDKWDCAWAWMPVLSLETSQRVTQVTAATNSFRNEMVRMNRPEYTQQLTPPVET